MQIRITAAITAAFTRKPFINASGMPLSFLGNQAGHGAACDLNPDVVWLDSQHQRIIIQGNNGSNDAAAGLDDITVLKSGEHLFLRLLLPLHGKEKQKVE